MDVLLNMLLGIGISAACGFRLFIPPLILSIAAQQFHLPLPEALSWLGTDTAFVVLLTAALLEVGAYYVPWLDHLLDTMATPASVVAGTMLSGAYLGEMTPVLKWSIALIAGGGAAGAIQSLTAGGRLASTATTASLANPMVATGENIMAVGLSTLSIAFPVIAAIFLLALIIGFWYTARRLYRAAQPRKLELDSSDPPALTS